jgi:hypothetical protein
VAGEASRPLCESVWLISDRFEADRCRELVIVSHAFSVLALHLRATSVGAKVRVRRAGAVGARDGGERLRKFGG